MDDPTFNLVGWSFSERKWVNHGVFASVVSAVEATQTLAGGYYRVDDTDHRGEVFYTGRDSSLYPRSPKITKEKTNDKAVQAKV